MDGLNGLGREGLHQAMLEYLCEIFSKGWEGVSGWKSVSVSGQS